MDISLLSFGLVWVLFASLSKVVVLSSVLPIIWHSLYFHFHRVLINAFIFMFILTITVYVKQVADLLISAAIVSCLILLSLAGFKDILKVLGAMLFLYAE